MRDAVLVWRRVLSVALSLTLVVGPALANMPAQALAAESTATSVDDDVVRELVERRTATSKHYLLSDGTQRAEIYSTPIFYEDESGEFAPIDTTLVQVDGAGTHRTAAAGARARFAGLGTTGSPVTLDVDGLSIGIDMVGVPERAHVAVGNQARYLDVADSVDLIYESMADGLKQTLILDSTAAPGEYTFFVSISGGQLIRTPGNGWAVFAQDAEAPSFTLGAIDVWDSASDAPQRCEEAVLDVVPASGGAYVTYSIPAGWLEAPERVFPVYVDPTLYVDQDTYIHSIGNTDYQGGNSTIAVGYNTTTGYNYGLVRFNTSELSGARVDSATFEIYVDSTSYDTRTYLGRNTSYWSESWRYSDGRPTYTYLDSQKVYTTGRIYWDVTGTVQQWAAGIGSPFWYGFQLYQDASQGTFHYKTFRSSEHATTSSRPKLIVDYTFLPDPATSTPDLSSNRAFDWYEEVDRDSDGISDTMNDLPRVGRGAVDLAWTASARATGYNIYMYDGDSYEKVGAVFGNTTTTWSSEGCGIYPADSEIEGWGLGQRNALARAASPSTETVTAQVPVPDESGAGLVVTDGKYLYVRQWGTYDGPAAWKKVGTGLNGTVEGEDYGTVGSDLSDRPALSAFYLDGFLFSGSATSEDTIEGVWKGAAEGSDEVKTLTFDSDLLDRSTAATSLANPNSLLLTSDGDKIYNVAYGIGGTSRNGYTIKVFNGDGTYTGTTATIPMASDYIDGVFCDGQALYLLQWVASNAAHVTKVRLVDMKVANQWLIDQGDTRVISGCYDDANNVFWLGALDTGDVYRYEGSGLDLRDNPEPLYEKSTTTTYLDYQNYWFKVVPFNSEGEANINECVAYTPTLENRTVGVNDDPRHTTVDLGEAAGHSLSAVFDEGTLEVATTDLSIATFGPATQLSRHYSSARTEDGSLAGAAGWIFDFERHLEFSANSITYSDETGEEHVFTLESGTYFPPNGEYSSLALDGSTYVLTYKDLSRDEFSASTGVLLASYDKSGNAVTYTPGTNALTIGAANGQSIVVDYTDGVVSGATYGTEDGTRTVSYATTGTPSVTYFDGTNCEYTVEYGYSAGLLSSITLLDYPEAGTDAVWSFSYSGNAFAGVQRPADTYAHTVISYTESSATLATHGDIGGTQGIAVLPDAEIETHYTWNPTGTTASVVDSHQTGATHSTWTYTYGPTNEAVTELSPVGKTISRELDSRGNVLYEWDEEGHRTAYRYDGLDQLTRMTDPRGQATYYTYGTDRYAGSGMLEAEERVLTATGMRSSTEYDYDSAGRMTEERSLVAGSEWAVTEYADFANSGEAQTTANVGVKLSTGAAAQDLVTSRAIDALGNTLSETDAAGIVTAVNTYDIAGRQLTSTDATGTSSISTYDSLGNVVSSRREATGGMWTDRTSKEYDAQGRLTTEFYYALDASETVVVDRAIVHTYDASGRETETDDSKVDGTALSLYDARGNIVNAYPEGADWGVALSSTRSVYDAYGQLTSQLEPGAETSATVYAYLPNGLTSRVDNPDGSYTEYTYDDGGLKTSEVTPVEGGGTASATFSYDVGGRLVSSTTADGATTTYAYDLLGRQISAAADGVTASTTTYNTLGWVLSETDSDGVIKTKTYDVCGRVVAEAEAGAITESAYDELGQLINTENADGSEKAATYDAFGQQVASEQRASDGTLVSDVTMTYDEQGRIESSADAAKETSATFTYASDGSTTVLKQIGDVTFTTTLNDLGLTASQSLVATGVPAIERELVTVDAALRPVGWEMNGTPSQISYNQAGSISADTAIGGSVGTSLPDPGEDVIVVACIAPAVASYEYDAATGRKSAEDFGFAFGSLHETSSYSYSSIGRLTSANIDGTNTTYAYELGSGNLTGMTRSAETTTFTYGDGNRLASMSGPHGTVTYGWNTTRGWRTSAQVSGQSAITFAFDEAGRLETYTDPNTDTTANYLYDAEGQRVRSVVAVDSVTTTTTYVYEGLLLQSYASERSDGATSSVVYLYDEQDDPIAGVYSSSETSSVAFTVIGTDRGDVRELQDVSGTSFAFYSYDAYGVPTSSLSAATASVDATLAATIAEANLLRYAGYCFDEYSDLYYLSQRYYDPATASFITKDPAKADGEESAYQYCGGDPVGKTDPSGLSTSVDGPSEWHNVSVNLLFGGNARFKFRMKVTWSLVGKNVKATTRIDVKDGLTWGGNFVVTRSLVVVTVRIRRPSGQEYTSTLGSLDYGLEDPGYESSASWGSMSKTVTSTTYSTYWIKSVTATGKLGISGGLSWPRPNASVPHTYTNNFGTVRPKK